MPSDKSKKSDRTGKLKAKITWILTNWNSVAAPAPASAFLSAPAKERRKNYNHWEKRKREVQQPDSFVYLRGAADRLYVSLSASPRFKRAGLSPSIPTQLQENKSKQMRLENHTNIPVHMHVIHSGNINFSFHSSTIVSSIAKGLHFLLHRSKVQNIFEEEWALSGPWISLIIEEHVQSDCRIHVDLEAEYLHKEYQLWRQPNFSNFWIKSFQQRSQNVKKPNSTNSKTNWFYSVAIHAMQYMNK